MDEVLSLTFVAAHVIAKSFSFSFQNISIKWELSCGHVAVVKGFCFYFDSVTIVFTEILQCPMGQVVFSPCVLFLG